MTTAIQTPTIKATTLRQAVKGLSSKELAMTVLMERAQRGELPSAVYAACYGLAYAVNTGRCNGKFALTYRAMDVKTLCGLVAEIANHCGSIADVPGFVNAHALSQY